MIIINFIKNFIKKKFNLKKILKILLFSGFNTHTNSYVGGFYVLCQVFYVLCRVFYVLCRVFYVLCRFFMFYVVFYVVFMFLCRIIIITLYNIFTLYIIL
jgi:hypothetical protein